MAMNLKEPSADFFDLEAEKFAEELFNLEPNIRKKVNKPSQLRRFYDHLVQIDDRVKQVPSDFEVLLPDIRMLNAHIAYAYGRELVSDKFKTKMQELIRSIDGTPKTLHNARLFFEATLGFLRAKRDD